MANHKSALKRIRSDERKRVRNRMVRGRARTFVKNAREAIDNGNVEAAQEATQQAIRELDKAVTKGVYHKNTASRTKSRLMKQLATLN